MDMQLPHFKTHICFVSDQTIPNLLLCFDDRLKPETVYLLTSKEMIEKGKYDVLAQNFKKYGVKVIKVELADISLFALEKSIEKFINDLPEEAINDYVFNITCGTKLMTVSTLLACNQCIEMFYVDTSFNKLFALKEKKEYALPSLCTVRNILNGYGYQELKSSAKQYLYGPLINKFLNTNEHMISRLNELAAMANNEKLSCEAGKLSPAMTRLFDECKKAGMLTLEGKTIRFKDKESRLFCNGTWLEEHVAYTLDQLQKTGNIADYERSVEVNFSDKTVSNKDTKPDNELDALFVRNNILFHIECKTSKMNNDKKVRDVIYKLDALRKKIGGVFAEGILISFKELSANERKFAEQSKIIVIDDRDKIKNLTKTLKDIIKEYDEKRK